jgi:hypothetical protein
MRVSLFRCPKCYQDVICEGVEDFWCPVCGFVGGNQLTLFRIGRENDGSIKRIGEFDPLKNALNAHFYHHNEATREQGERKR